MGYDLLLGQTARPLLFLMVDDTDHITGKVGLSPTVTLSKNGAAFAAPAGAVTEVGVGWYKVAGNAVDEDALGPLLVHGEAAGADPVDDRFRVVAYDPDDATDLGLSNLDAPVSAIPTTPMRGTDGVDTAAMRGTDGVDTAAMRGTDGVDTATMRGTDGANTVVPDNAGIAATQAKTDNLPADPASETNVDAEGAATRSQGAAGPWTTAVVPVVDDQVEVDGGFGLDAANLLSGLVWVEDNGKRRTDFNSPTVSAVTVTVERDSGSIAYAVTPTVDAARGLIHFAAGAVLPDNLPIMVAVRIDFTGGTFAEGGIPVVKIAE